MGTTYKDFLAIVRANGWTWEQLRCDVRPTPELLEVMDRFGLDKWEKFLVRFEREVRQ